MQQILSHPPTIDTARLTLRPLSMADDEDIFEYESDPEVTKYVTFETGKVIDDARIFITSVLDNYARGSEPACLGIVLKNENKLIGTIGYLSWSAVHKRVELGYVLSQPYWNKGYVSEAAKAMVNYLFCNTDLIRIEAKCRVENIRSAHVLEKIGMQYEGILRKHVFIKGEHWDLKIYSILRDEWERENNY